MKLPRMTARIRNGSAWNKVEMKRRMTRRAASLQEMKHRELNSRRSS